MCNANEEMVKAAKELMELKELQDELQAEIDVLTNRIKQFMGDEEHMLAGAYNISFKNVVTFRIDSAALKKELPDVASKYSKMVNTRRFTIN